MPRQLCAQCGNRIQTPDTAVSDAALLFCDKVCKANYRISRKRVFKREPETRSSDKPLASSTGRGSGTKLLGESSHKLVASPGRLLVSVVKTKFFCILNIPLIPLASYRVVIGETAKEGNLVIGPIEKTPILVLEKVPLNLLQIIEVYAFAFLCLGGIPLAATAARSVLVEERGVVSVIIFFATFVLWLIACYAGCWAFLAFRQKRRIAAQLAESASAARKDEETRALREEDDTRFMPPEMRREHNE